jgi:hypothetical protein
MNLFNRCSTIIVFIACGLLKLPAQGYYSGVLAGWDFHSLPGGVSSFGISPLAPSSLETNLSAPGLVRGSGVGTNGTAASRGWGGNGFTSGSEAAAVAANAFVTFSYTANPLYLVTYTNINELDYRRSSTGPASGALQYQVGNSPFVDITNLSYPVTTSGGGSLGPVNLAAIAALKNIPAGVPVTFRIVNWGATSASGTWYLYDVSNTAALDLSVQGTIQLNYDTFLPASDSGPGFFSGENLILTNNSGVNLYVWSSPTPALSVTNWTLEGAMTEIPLGTTGHSRYGINLNPDTSPVYYIFAQTNNGLFTAAESLTWLTTDDFSSYTVTSSNVAISADGVFAIPAAPLLLSSPTDTNVYAGKPANLSVVASASGPLSFQWFQKGNALADVGAIAGSQSNRLTFSPAATNQTGYYFVVFTNQLGAVTSSAALFNVVPLPALAISNSAASLTLSASGGAVNTAYVIQLTTNLAPPIVWSPLQTNVVGTNGLIGFTTTNLNTPANFYRLQFP